MEAEPTHETRERTPLAAVSTRLRGLLRHPFTLRALVIGGLAVAGWLLGAGGAASAASAAVAPAADGKAVTDQVGQVGDAVHAAGSGAVHRVAGASVNRTTKPDDESAVGGPVRQRIGGLVHAGRDAASRATDRLDHGPVAEKAHADRAGPSVRHVTGLADRTAPRRAAGTHEISGAAARADSLLGGGTNQAGAPLPVGGALNVPSSITGSMTRYDPSCAPTSAAAMRDGGVRACTAADASSRGAPAASGTDGPERLTAGPAAAMPRPALGRPGRPATPYGYDTRPGRPMCVRPAAPCGHHTHPLPAVPPAPAPAGPGSGTYGVVPPSASGQALPGSGDLAWTHLDHPPRDMAIVPARRGVLPPVVRTAADEPALSPD